MTTPERLKPVELFAWIGEDELGSGVIGLKQGHVPAGYIPLVATSAEKINPDYLQEQLRVQAATYGKKIYLCRFTLAEVVSTTPAGEPVE